MTWKFTSMSRTFSTSRIQRDVIQHHGHSGSNQKPASSFLAILKILSTGNGTQLRAAQLSTPGACSRPGTRVGGVALPNLTRDQAAERAALVTVNAYRIALDLTDGNGSPGER